MSPSKVEPLLVPYWLDGKLCVENLETIEEVKNRAVEQLLSLRDDFKRILNPTPYKVLNMSIFIIFCKSYFILFKNRLQFLRSCTASCIISG